MNLIKTSRSLCLLLLSLALALPMQAQNEKTNVKKDLAKVLKELPPEMQLQILTYAERKRDAWVATQNEMSSTATVAAEAKVTPPAAAPQPEQAKVVVAPQPAKPAEIALSPKPVGTATKVEAPATPAPPKQPDYMEKAATAPQTTIEWEEMEYNYGSVKTGEIVKHTFRFKNTGTNPLILTRVKASCGCTTPKYSTEAVPPGGEGFIDVSFNTTGKSGVQRKSVTVTANVQPINTALRINGEVSPAAAQ